MRRITATVVAPLTAAALLLSACGGESSAGAGGLDSVTMTGELGAAPEVAWDGELKPERLETEVLIAGEGAELAEGDQVLADLWIGNGFTQQEVYNSHEEGSAPELLTVNDELSPGIRAAVEGQRLGSRVAIAAPPADAFGESGNAGLGIGNEDGVLFVVDLLSGVLSGPQGKEQQPPRGVPTLNQEDGRPTGFDFSGARRPGKKLGVTTLVTGDGAVVEEGQTIVVNYLGSVFGKKKVFDQSYDRGEPTSFPIGVGGVIKGWDQGLVGQTVGSRVLLVIPSRLGYGKKGSGEDIKGGDDLVFVVDILAAG